MISELREAWHELQDAEPGRRFRERYRRRTHDSHGRVRKPLVLAGGIALIVIGLVGIVAPGPGLVGVAVGGALVAEESYFAATVLDKLEITLRRLGASALRLWNTASGALRAALVLSAVVIALLATFLAWRVLFA
jgi:hypothetical protein